MERIADRLDALPLSLPTSGGRPAVHATTESALADWRQRQS
ncbi:hypothetical protein [Streptomyces sp. NPDC007905]